MWWCGGGLISGLLQAVFPASGPVQVTNLAVLSRADARNIDLAASLKTKSYRLLVRAPGIQQLPQVACPLQILQVRAIDGIDLI